MDLIERRDWSGLIAAGGNIYLLLRSPAPSGRTCCRWARRCAARRSTHFMADRPGKQGKAVERRRADMARIVGGIGCSHAPSIAHSYDRRLQKDPMWAPLYRRLRAGEGVARRGSSPT